MNYKKIYASLIMKRRQNSLPPEIYGENHHIIPHCIGGKDIAANIIRFSAREHYIAHALLVKIYKGQKKYYYKLLNAYSAMVYLWDRVSKKDNPRNINKNSHLYKKWREEISEYKKKYFHGKNSIVYGRKAISNLKTKQLKYVKDPEPYLKSGDWILGNLYSQKNKGTNSISWNTTHIYNLATGKGKLIDKDLPIPKGWAKGYAAASKIHVQHYNPTKGKIRIYNDKLKKNKLIDPSEEIPIGWKKGILFKHPKSGKKQRHVSGTLDKMAIVNVKTKESKYIPKDSAIPVGWIRGRTVKPPKKACLGKGLKGRMWITNSALRKNKVIEKSEAVPEGWALGRKNY